MFCFGANLKIKAFIPNIQCIGSETHLDIQLEIYDQHNFMIFIAPTKCVGLFILQLNKAKDSACEYCRGRNGLDCFQEI